MPSPNIDPTLLISVRKRLNSAISLRFEQLRKDIQSLVVKEDAFGLRSNDIIGNAAGGRWRFLTSSQRLEEFKGWISSRIDAGLLLPDPNAPPAAPWLGGFVQTAYTSGLGRSFTDAKTGGLLPKSLSAGNAPAFVSQTLTNPSRMETLRLLYARSFTQLKGVSTRMADAMSIILADEFSKQSSPTIIAARLSKEVGIAANRAKAIAQTELTYAQAEGQLDAYEDMGLGDTVKLKVMVEWQTGSNPCESCAALRGIVLTLKEARGKIPMHPHCRCAWGRVNIYAPPTLGQKRSKKSIQEALNKALKTSTRKRTAAEARKSSRWAGASLRPTGKRTLATPKGAGVFGAAPYLPPKDKRQTAGGVVYSPNNKTPARIREAGAAGVPFAIGGADVLQQSGVVYTTQDSKGGQRTHVSITVTPAGSRKITETLGRDFEQERSRFREGQIHPQDAYFNGISSASRMVEVRSKEGKYNEGLLNVTQKNIDHFSGVLSGKIPSSTVEREMASHYLPQARAVLEAKASGKQPPEITPYRPTPSPMNTRKSPFPVEKTAITSDVRAFGDVPKDSNRTNKYEGESYRVKVSPRVDVYFVPHEGVPKGAGAAFQGTLEVVVQGKPSRASIDAGLRAIQSLGVSTKPLTKAGEELAYLQDTVLRNGASPKQVQKIAKDLLLTDAQKVAKIKEWAKANGGYDFRKNPPKGYNPQGRSLLPSGRGPRVFDRWDISREETQGLLVQYTTASRRNEQGSSISSIVRQSLQSGGSLDSLAEKTRKGVPNPPGAVSARRASNSIDGAELVARVRKEGSASTTTGIYFKSDSLLRTDATVYAGGPDRKRATTPSQWAVAATDRFNEVRFKHGLSLLNDLEFIRVVDSKEKATVLRAFKDMGVTQLQDGRTIESIIAVRDGGNTYTKSSSLGR